MGMTSPTEVELAEAAALELCAEARDAAVASTVKRVYCILVLVECRSLEAIERVL